ncbi:unnamed protein product, partial [Mesorhabditis belari]|uniref:RRM domain-containing protein n=1 Tax=Mesorhabditis belari TaxID=2138241 RepID=A0AAF3J726_9BILA
MLVATSGPSLAGPGGSDASENGQQDGKDERRPPYTMHGVLHFVQHEWGRYEMERAKWEMERAELQARISFLQGERKGQENLRHDLVRRIKMLEYCLKQERAKCYRLSHNGEEPPEMDYRDEEEANKDAPTATATTEVDPFPPNLHGFKAGRLLLKQYLEEIGYSEAVMDVRAFRMKNLVNLMQQTDEDADVKRKKAKERSDSDSDNDEQRQELDMETADALHEFNFLEKSDDNWDGNVNAGQLEAKIERYRNEKRSKRNSGGSGGPNDETRGSKDFNDQSIEELDGHHSEKLAFKGKSKGEFADINEALGLVDDAIDIKDNFAGEDDDMRQTPKWNLALTLRSHLDSVRAMQFHPVEPVLFTTSEDSTCKMWNLDMKTKEDKYVEIEPAYTFRGHYGPSLCLDLSPTGDHLYTGGFDGVICCWSIPLNISDVYDKYDSAVLVERLVGHTDAVWSVAYHSSDTRLVSASADKTIRVWEPGMFGDSPLLKTYTGWVENSTPTSLDFVSTETQQLLTAFKSNIAGILDIETGQNVVKFDFGEDATNGSDVNKILSHPTMPMTITGGEDRKLRYFDNRTGELVHAAIAHVESISSLAVDPNGLYLLSGSHDGSLRLWNMEKRVCLQEVAAHRKKLDASVNTVAFHPSRPYIGSAGADALAKVFTTSSISFEDPIIDQMNYGQNGIAFQQIEMDTDVKNVELASSMTASSSTPVPPPPQVAATTYYPMHSAPTPNIPMPFLQQAGEVYVGPGAQKEAGLVGLGLKKLRSRDKDRLYDAKRYAMDISIKQIMLRQQQVHQQNQQKQQMYAQALSLMARVYVGSISFEIREDMLRKAMEPFGPIKTLNMSWDAGSGHHKGFAFLEYEVPEAASLAQEQMNGLLMGGRNLKMGRTTPSTPQAQPIIDMVMTEAKKYYRVYVASVHPDLSETDVKSVFEAFGEVVSCRLARNAVKGGHRGFGYIEFNNATSMTEAVAGMNMFDLGGQFLRVGRCVTPPEALNYIVPAAPSALPQSTAMALAAATAKVQALEATQGSSSPSGSSQMNPFNSSTPPGGYSATSYYSPLPEKYLYLWSLFGYMYIYEIFLKPKSNGSAGAASPSTSTLFGQRDASPVFASPKAASPAPPPPPPPPPVAANPTSLAPPSPVPPPQPPIAAFAEPIAPPLPPPSPEPAPVEDDRPAWERFMKKDPEPRSRAEVPMEVDDVKPDVKPIPPKAAANIPPPGLLKVPQPTVVVPRLHSKEKTKESKSIFDRIKVHATLNPGEIATFGPTESSGALEEDEDDETGPLAITSGSSGKGDIQSLALTIMDGGSQVQLIKAKAEKDAAYKEAAKKAAKIKRKTKPVKASNTKGPKLNSDAALAAAEKAGAMSDQIIDKEVNKDEATLASQEGLEIRGNDSRHLLMTKLMRVNRSQILMLKNMVSAEEIDDLLEDEIKEECSKYGDVEDVLIVNDEANDVVKIFVKFSTTNQVDDAKKALDGRFFGGRTISASVYDQALFDHEDYSGY